METVALFGIGAEAGEIVQEFMRLYWPTVKIESIFFNDNKFWGFEILPGVHIERPAEIVKHRFEKMIICGIPDYAEAVKPVLAKKMGMDENKIVAYHEWLEFNSGMHEIDWRTVYREADIVSQLRECGTLNEMETFYYSQTHRQMTKYLHYFEVCDRHFRKFRNTECVVVEIGVCKGGSLQMWKNYFGGKATIIGIDIDEDTLAFTEDQVIVEIGSQSDPSFWEKFREKYPRVDILIDDGGHTMDQQIITFEEMFHHIAEDGVYLCEDMHTSYWSRYGGGYKNPASYVEYTKNFIDYINAWYNFDINEKNPYTCAMHSLHYYDSMLVIEKRKMHRAVCITMG